MFATLGLDELETFLKIQKAYTYQPKLNSNSIIPMCRLYSGSPQLEHHHPEMLFPGAQTILPIVGIVGCIAVIAAFMAIAWKVMKTGQDRQMPLVMGFCIITGLLLNPVCHQYYYVFAVPVIWNLIVYADPIRRVGRAIEDDWVGFCMWAGALVAFLLLALESPGFMEPDEATGFFMNAPLGYGTTIVAGLLLWLTTAIALVFSQPIKNVKSQPQSVSGDSRQPVSVS
jgi:hypothetical protein